MILVSFDCYDIQLSSDTKTIRSGGVFPEKSSKTYKSFETSHDHLYNRFCVLSSRIFFTKYIFKFPPKLKIRVLAGIQILNQFQKIANFKRDYLDKDNEIFCDMPFSKLDSIAKPVLSIH